LGGPGTGKTTVMIEKIAKLLDKGIAPRDIGIATFSYRSLLLLRAMLAARFGRTANDLITGTVVDLALKSMHDAGDELPEMIDNTQVRRLLRQAMKETDFPGNVVEAEHIMRQFKSRGQKPNENQPHFALFIAYRDLLEKSGKIDRHDVARRQIIGFRNEVYPALKIKYLFVDNIQDATQIQLYWVSDHLEPRVGIRVMVFGDDDQCQFSFDGALGGPAFNDLEETRNLTRLVLTKDFRCSRPIGQAANALVRKNLGRLPKKMDPAEGGQGTLQILTFQDLDSEMAALLRRVREVIASGTERVGIITRLDTQARRVSRRLQKEGIAHSSYARPIWETPGATLMLDMLELLLNRATDDKLQNIFTALGIPRQAIEMLFAKGLTADTWLRRGAPLPKDITEAGLANSVLQELGTIQRRFLTYAQYMKEAGPKDVFKAACFDMLQKLNPEERENALFALEELLSLSGKLTEQLAAILEAPQPDPLARVVVAPTKEVRNMQFENVFMPFCTSRVYPMAYKVLAADEKNDRRLFYVAMTRASHRLILSASGEPSPFLSDLEPFLPSAGAA
jgi:DNA helicase-2/ATP-dependent DNA helicase PcrA